MNQEEMRRRRRDVPPLVEGLINDLTAVLWEADPQTFQFTYVSQGAERLLGFPLSAWLEEVDFWARNLHPDDQAEAVAHCLLATHDGRNHDFQYRMVAADGSVRWIHEFVRLRVDARGQATRLSGLLLDTTEQCREGEAGSGLAHKRQGEKRDRAEAPYRDIFLGAPLGIARITADGQLLTANPELARMLGFDPSVDLASLNIAHDVYLHEADRARVVAAAQASGAVTDLEVQWKKKDGSAIWVELSLQAARDHAGAVRYVELFVRDISTQKLRAAQLRQAQRMEAIGQLAGGVAHDFNNILTAILGNAGLLLEALAPTDSRREDVEEIRLAAQRGASLTGQLLAFSRKEVLAVQTVDVNAVVRGIEHMLQRLIGEDVALQLTLAPDLGTVLADPGQLEQVIMNLVVNARDALAPLPFGLITIETDNEELDVTYSALRVAVAPGPYVVLAVTDTGTGMDPETEARIFEPFFTTKEPGKGTGLGLSTVYGIVQQSGGHISVYSEVGHGTTMKVHLPRLGGVAEIRGSAAPTIEPPRGTETILVVEDEESVRTLARRALAAGGYTVLEAAGGAEALRVAKTHAGPIHLLLTDVVMPDIRGPELAAGFTAERPDMRVLYMSGYPSGALLEEALGVSSHYLAKPFTPSELRHKVREILDATGGQAS